MRYSKDANRQPCVSRRTQNSVIVESLVHVRRTDADEFCKNTLGIRHQQIAAAVVVPIYVRAKCMIVPNRISDNTVVGDLMEALFVIHILYVEAFDADRVEVRDDIEISGSGRVQ